MSVKPNALANLETNNKIVVVYDGECPFCKNYVRLMALKDAIGDAYLVDARTQDPATRKLADLGYDLNEGMAAIYGGKIYYGQDAVVLISSLTSKRDWLGRLLAILLRNPARASFLYPLLKAARRITLRMLGKPLI
jgi:predicted DCC family thiol-disulfide oxidoreductase YuxK